ncbi:MAG: hypothetical protein ACKVPX_18645 [Myxococcaceae bacterium]
MRFTAPEARAFLGDAVRLRLGEVGASAPQLEVRMRRDALRLLPEEVALALAVALGRW